MDPPSPLRHPHEGSGEKETSSVSLRFLYQSCILHILCWWTVPAGTAEEHINNSTARARPLRILSHSSFETCPTPEFSQIYFTQTSDEHALFSFLGSFSGSSLKLLLAQTLPEPLHVAWIIRNDGIIKYEKKNRKRKMLIIFVLVIIWKWISLVPFLFQFIKLS